MKNTLSYFLIIIGLNLFNPAFSQEIEWQNTIGGSSMDRMVSIQQTFDGGYICAGETSSGISGDKTEAGRGGNDFWIIRLNISGNILWQKTIGGSGNEYLKEIHQTLDGGYILGGGSYSDSSGDKSENSQGLLDFWILKLDSIGNIEWQNTIGGSGHDALTSVKQTSDGGYICGGLSNSNISGDKNENSRGDNDFWILKLDSSGNISWQKTYGGVNEDNLYALVPTIGSGYICGGISKSNISGEKSENCLGASDYWILKLDSIGNIEWQNTIGGNDEDILTSISIANSGNYYCAGHSSSNISSDKNENCFGDVDFWILMLDSSGILQWQNTIGGFGHDSFCSICSTNDGGCIVSGMSNSSVGGKKSEVNLGGDDFWIIKLNDNGKIEWQNTIGGNSLDDVYCIKQNVDNSYILGGESISDISFDKLEDNQGSSDFWVVKLIGEYNSITGNIYFDINSNNLKDTNETDISFKQINELTTSRLTFTNQNGEYNILIPDSGNFIISPENINYFSNMPLNHFANFNSIQEIDSLNDFAIQSSGVFNDLCIKLIPVGNFRSGFNASYNLNYSNQGTTILNPTIIFYPDDNITFVSSNPIPNTISPDSIVWNIGNIQPFSSDKISVIVNVNLGLPLGTLINSGVLIEPIVGDANTICNQSYWEVLTTGSADPNEILVSEDSLTTTEISNGQYLDYIIHFQNTGNDTAFTVKILNPIDTNRLNLLTFEYLNSSHSLNLNWNSWENNMEFKFDNILLPDSTINEPMSHGYVSYRIQPKQSLLPGNNIYNFAAIYFDFNDPVITNTATTNIVLPTSIEEHPANIISFYPNPFDNQITLELKGYANQRVVIELSNIYSQKVKALYSGTIELDNYSKKLDLGGLAKGVYILSIKGKTSITQKLVKL